MLRRSPGRPSARAAAPAPGWGKGKESHLGDSMGFVKGPIVSLIGGIFAHAHLYLHRE